MMKRKGIGFVEGIITCDFGFNLRGSAVQREGG